MVEGDPVFAEYSQLAIAEYANQRQARYAEGYGVLIFCSVCAGVILLCMGIFKFGSFVAKVPHSIVVGFTIGIALTIALPQVGDVLGLKVKLHYPLIEKVQLIVANIGQFNILAVLLAVGTFLVTKYLLKISVCIPGPLIAIGAGYAITQTVLSGQGLTVASDKYGPIPTDDFFTFTAAVVLLKDFLTGVPGALIIYALLHRFFDKPPEVDASAADVSNPDTAAKLEPVGA